MWGIVDCDNCFVSCERVFRPDLNGRAVVVLSNNDGCVVARSNEAKAMGIKMGLPYYQMLQMFRGQDITAFSSNYELYGDMSDRIMSILREEAPEVLQYSIDEAFLNLKGMEESQLKKWGEKLSAKILQWTDMPVSIGIAPTKTLAKVASRFAKRYPHYNKCCIIGDEEQRVTALQMTDIGDVWGIGRQWRERLKRRGIITAYDFTQWSAGWVKEVMNITGLKTWRELRGEDCIDADSHDVTRQSICTSRSFAEMTEDITTMQTQVSNFAVRCAEKLRRQKTVASMVTVFIDTNRFREDLPQYGCSCSRELLTPTSTSVEISSVAISLLDRIFRRGFMYKRAGVIVTGITDDLAIQTDFSDYDAERRTKLVKLTQSMDDINYKNGSETVILGTQQYFAMGKDGKHSRFASSIKRALKSPCYTRNPDEFKVR